MSLRNFFFLGCLFVLTGCGGLKLVPVAGNVTRNGKPMQGGGVSLIPDKAKGNEASVACIAWIGGDGRYEIKTAGVQASDTGVGAPVGWYKVTLLNRRGTPDLDIDPIYLNPELTPLAFEVVANPESGRYDIALAK